jgi:hypothetical protein
MTITGWGVSEIFKINEGLCYTTGQGSWDVDWSTSSKWSFIWLENNVKASLKDKISMKYDLMAFCWQLNHENEMHMWFKSSNIFSLQYAWNTWLGFVIVILTSNFDLHVSSFDFFSSIVITMETVLI